MTRTALLLTTIAAAISFGGTAHAGHCAGTQTAEELRACMAEHNVVPPPGTVVPPMRKFPPLFPSSGVFHPPAAISPPMERAPTMRQDLKPREQVR